MEFLIEQLETVEHRFASDMTIVKQSRQVAQSAEK